GDGTGGGGVVGASTVRARDAHAGGDLCAGRGRLPARRRGRHRLGRDGCCEDQSGRVPDRALQRARVPRAATRRNHQFRAVRSAASWWAGENRRACGDGRRRDDGGDVAGLSAYFFANLSTPCRACEALAKLKCNYWPLATRMRRTISQIGTTTAAPRRR